MNEKIKQLIFLSIAIFGVFLFPFLILNYIGYIDLVDYEYAIPQVVKQLAQQSIMNNLLTHIALVTTSLIIIFFSTTFLFRIRFKSETVLKIKEKKLQYFFFKHLGFEHKSQWHIFLGYFLAILAFDSFVAYDFSQTQGANLYASYTVILPSIAILLLIARIFSHFDFRIIDINIGNFIVLAYVSQFIYSVMSSGHFPASQIVNWISFPPQNFQTVFIVYFSIVSTALLTTYLDWLIVRFLLKKRDRANDEITTKPRKTKLNISILIGIPLSCLILFLIFNPLYFESDIPDFRDTKFLKLASDEEIMIIKNENDPNRLTNLDLGYTVKKPIWRWHFIEDLVKHNEKKTGLPTASGVMGGSLVDLTREVNYVIVVQNVSEASDFISLENFYNRKFSGLNAKTGEKFEILEQIFSKDGKNAYISTISRIDDKYQYQFYSSRIYDEKLYEIQIKTAGSPEDITPYSLEDLNFIHNSFRIIPS